VIKKILFILTISSIFACSGQLKSNKQTPKSAPSNFGVVVDNLGDDIWSIFHDSRDRMWYGSNGQGVYLYENNILTQITKDDGLVDNTIRGIQEDSLGNIYVETPDGVSKYDGHKFSTIKIERFQQNKWALNKADMWFTCNARANDVYKYDGDVMYELKLPRIDDQAKLGININTISYNPYAVFGIDKDDDGNIWFGTILMGAYRYDGESFLWVGEKELSRLEDGREPGVRSMLQDKNGYHWLSNFKSRYKVIEKPTLNYEKSIGFDIMKEGHGDKLPYFNSGIKDKYGNLWMTTYGGGVWKYDGYKLSNIEVRHNDEEALLITIYMDNNEGLWLGTNNIGVFKYNGKTFEKFDPPTFRK